MLSTFIVELKLIFSELISKELFKQSGEKLPDERTPTVILLSDPIVMVPSPALNKLEALLKC